MEGAKQNRKRKQRDQADNEQDEQMEDVEMAGQTNEESTTSAEGRRKIIQVKKRVHNPDKIIDEGEEVEFEGSEEEYEEEDIVERNEESEEEGWEDVNESGDEEQMKDQTEKKGKKVMWDPSVDPIKEGEELVFDNSAYQMLHRAKVEWPCLSIDVLLRDRIGTHTNASGYFPQYIHTMNPQHTYQDKRGLTIHKQDKFPYTFYFCAGSQSEKKNENKIYVMKWSDMVKTLKDDEVDSQNEDEEDENDKDPVMRYECIPHKGCVNRIRSMYGTGVVATWNDQNEVGIYNVSSAVEALDEKNDKKEKKSYGGTKLASFKHTDEGYALDWSPLTYGRLASGGCNAQIWLYQPADETCSSFVKELQVGLQQHKKSVEDLQFSPSQEHVLASCSVDQTVKLWDLRATQMKAQVSWRAHDCDVNVISWNTTSKFLLASGDDKGEFRIWDLRMIKPNQYEQKDFDSITRIRWHTQAITSIQFEPGEDSVLAVSSADNKLTIWDFSVEVDEAAQDEENDIPPQLMFLHQGQDNIKELRFHPYYREMLVTTAEDSYNIFRPNLEPDEDEANPEAIHEDGEESKESTKQSSSMKNNIDYYIDSEEEEEEEQRYIRTAKKLNRQQNRQNRDEVRNKKKDDKRRKLK